MKYALLEYQYSSDALHERWGSRLFGISLCQPSAFLNGTDWVASQQSSLPSIHDYPFLWQAPNSDALLIAGDKWMAAHNYVSKFLRARERLSAALPPIFTQTIVHSKASPGWLEYLAQVCRLRGFLTIYPSADTASVVATIHNDLISHEVDDGELESEISSRTSSRAREVALRTSSVDMLDTLPEDGHLPPFGNMAVLDWGGSLVDLKQMDGDSRAYALGFRKEVGGCVPDEVQKPEMGKTATELFCK